MFSQYVRCFHIGVVFFSFLMLASCDDEKSDANGAMPVKVGPPITKMLTEWDEFTGRFRALERVEITARVSGYLEATKFEDGQRVKKDDVLFIIDQRPYQIALERAQARHELASKEYNRSKTLRASSAGSQQRLDVSYQELRDAKAALDEAKLNMEFTEVKSPIDGRVSRNFVDAGNLVSGGDTPTLLTTVVRDDPIDFYFEASEQEILKYIKLDQEGTRESSRTVKRPIYVKLQDEGDYIHKGYIDFVDNEVDSQTGTLQARAVFDNPDEKFLPGIFGRARMAGSGHYEAMLVPDAVIGTNQSQKFVYVVNKDDMVELRSVTLGPLHDNDLRIIRSGLAMQDRVIMGGITMLRPGMKISPQLADPIATPDDEPQAAAPVTQDAAPDSDEAVIDAESGDATEAGE